MYVENIRAEFQYNSKIKDDSGFMSHPPIEDNTIKIKS